MLYDLKAAQDNIRNRDGRRVFYLGTGDQLNSEARDYLNRERIAILPAREAKPQRYVLLTGGYAEEKPEHMTHLEGNVLVPKTHPRIRFRGAVDTLEGELLLAVSRARGEPRQWLEEILACVRKLIPRELLGEQAGQERLLGLTEQELRTHSHRPQDFYGQPHFMPTGAESPLLLQVNKARCAARQAELAGAEAFQDREGNPVREDLLRLLNRLSSALYIVMIRLKAREKEDGHGAS